jgi:two-component system response regulator
MIETSDPVQILYVEDDPSDAKLTLRTLRKAGLANQIHHVTDGEQALDFLFCRGVYVDRGIAQLPQVVFLDIHLPKIDGIEVLRQIRDDRRTSSLPVVLLTSSRLDIDVLAGYDLHANSYIVKPVDFQKFVESVTLLGMYWVLQNTPPARLAEALPDARSAT